MIFTGSSLPVLVLRHTKTEDSLSETVYDEAVKSMMRPV